SRAYGTQVVKQPDTQHSRAGLFSLRPYGALNADTVQAVRLNIANRHAICRCTFRLVRTDE
ncbi:MAG TPA: hypothetical protein VFG11_02050, partial [Acidobacteriota bacterium]|nr:hypothetical protein [Acidobacteriota bacterium]